MGEQFSIIGYHKTRQDRASKILSSKKFPISKRDDLWLGDGVYFWDALDNAKWWNSNIYRDGAILSAKLTCDIDLFLDLDNEEHMRRLVEFVETRKRDFEEDQLDLDFKSDHQIQAFFCTQYKEEFSIQLIKHSFPWYEKNIAGFREIKKRAQYCATDNEIISDIKLFRVDSRLEGDNVDFIV